MVFRSNRLKAVIAFLGQGALFAFLLLLMMPAVAGTVGLAWDPVVNPALRGYMVHHGPAAGNYTTSIDVGNTTSYTVTNLTEGATYHFAVTAYDAARTQSAYSNDVVGDGRVCQTRRRLQCEHDLGTGTAGDELHQ